MSSDYTPTNVTSGFEIEVAINKNFNDIKTAMDKLLNREVSTDNAMEQNLDLGGFFVLNAPSPVSPTDVVRLQDVNTLAIPEVVQTVTFSTSISIAANTITMARITMTDNTTITFTGTPNDGQPIMLLLTQDATGSRTVTWDAKMRFSTDLAEPTLSTIGGTLDYLVFRYNLVDDKFDLLAVNRGF